MYLSATKHLSAVVSLLCNSENCLLFVFRVTLIEGPGKQDKVVPHILTNKMVSALDEITFNRDECGILNEKIFFYLRTKKKDPSTSIKPSSQLQKRLAVMSPKILPPSIIGHILVSN